jgi:hypothetical protein
LKQALLQRALLKQRLEATGLSRQLKQAIEAGARLAYDEK